MDTEYKIDRITKNILRNRAFIETVARLVKHNTQRVLGELKAANMMKGFTETDGGNNGRRLVAISPQ